MTALDPVHPGEILKHDFMDPWGLPQYGHRPIIEQAGCMPACSCRRSIRVEIFRL